MIAMDMILQPTLTFFHVLLRESEPAWLTFLKSEPVHFPDSEPHWIIYIHEEGEPDHPLKKVNHAGSLFKKVNRFTLQRK